jgi:uncharacterized protein (DUF1501 family)
MCNAPFHHGGRLGKHASRRDILKITLGAAGFAALGPLTGRLPVARGAVATQTTLVLINMFGGNDGLNTVVPRGLNGYFERRPVIQIPSGQELSLAGGPNGTSAYGLHPQMTRLQTMWNDGDVAIVNLVGYPDANQSHFESEDIWSFAMRNGAGGALSVPSGWIARYADRNAPSPLGAMSVGIGRRRDFLGGSTNPLQVGRLSDFQFQRDGSYRDNHLHRLQTVRNLLAQQPTTGLSGEARSALDTAHQLVNQVQAAITGYQSQVVYPNQGLARSMQDVARLVFAGFPTRVFYTGFGGFDTHSEQSAVDGNGAVTGQHANLMLRLDEAIGAYAADAKAMGTWDRTVIAVISEFGRRNFENGSQGTDHGHAQCVLLVGGAVNGGSYGPTMTEAMLQEDQLEYRVDFRDIYREVLGDHLGATGLGQIFPETQEFNATLGIV